MNLSKKPKIGFSYLLALAVVSFSRFAWLPWMVIYLHQRKYNSWASTVSAYGLLVSCFQMGQYLGHTLTKSNLLNSSWFLLSFMTLTGSFIAVCFITRHTIVLILFGLIGFSGTILTGVSINMDVHSPQLPILKRASELEINDNMDKNLASFAFVILIAGYIYNSQPLVQVPMYYLAAVLAFFCLVVLAYYLLMSKMVKSKGKLTGTPNLTGGAQQNNQSSTSEALAAPVDEYTGPVASNFYSCCGKNITKARAMYGKMLRWRRNKNVDTILETPQQHFQSILKYYPHAIHGYSVDGCAVVYELLGKGDMAGLKGIGATIDEIVWHFALRNELVFEKLLDPVYMQKQGITPPNVPLSSADRSEVLDKPVRRLMTVLDVGGIGYNAASIDVINFIQKSGELIDNYYPEQVARLVIVNAPYWFSGIWGVIARALPESVKKKVDILSSMQDLDKYIHTSQRPEAYGGTGMPLGQAPGHLEFLALEQRWSGVAPPVTAAATPPPLPPPAPSSTPAAPAHKGTPSATGDTKAKKGLVGWASGIFQRPQAAYLGEELTLRYNSVTKSWDDAGAVGENSPHVHLQSHNQAIDSRNRAEQNSATGTGTSANPVSSEKSPADHYNHYKNQLDDHGLVLAIQAAHRASAILEAGTLSTMEEGKSPKSDLRTFSFHEADGTDREGRGNNLLRSHSADDPENGDGAGRSADKNILSAKLSPKLFLLVVTIYIFCLWVQTALFTLIPVWMVIPISAGGMEYSVREVSLVLSSAAIFTLIGYKLLARRSEYILKSSPVRTLRIGCGLLVIVLFLLPWAMEYTGRSADQPAILADGRVAITGTNIGVGAASGPVIDYDLDGVQNRIKFIKVFGKVLPYQGPLSYSTFVTADHHNVAYDYVHWASSKYNFANRSILALQVPACLLALLMGGLHICRRASGVLLHLTLGSTFHSPSSVRRALNGFIDIAGPTLVACLFSLCYSMGLKYPMDASSFFAVSGCLILSVYIGSMLLKVQFRGDYGVMADTRESSQPAAQAAHRRLSEEGSSEAPSNQDGSQAQLYLRKNRRSSSSLSQHSDSAVAPAVVSRLSVLENTFSVPLGDASLLYTPAHATYGSKLYNLKDDFKDV